MPDDRLQRTRDAYRRDDPYARAYVTAKNASEAAIQRRHNQTDPIRLSDTLTTEHWNTIEGGDH
jgi:hypothetical protein